MSLRLDGALSPVEEHALDEHLAQCAACRAIWACLQSADAMLEPLELVEPTPQLAPRVMQCVQRRAQRLNLARAGLSVLLVILMLSTLFIAPLRALFSLSGRVASRPALVSTIVAALKHLATVLGTVLRAAQVVLQAFLASPTWVLVVGYLAICALVTVSWAKLALQRPRTDR